LGMFSGRPSLESWPTEAGSAVSHLSHRERVRHHRRVPSTLAQNPYESAYIRMEKPKPADSPSSRLENLDRFVPRRDFPPSLYRWTLVTKMLWAHVVLFSWKLAQNVPRQSEPSIWRGAHLRNLATQESLLVRDSSRLRTHSTDERFVLITAYLRRSFSLGTVSS